ncbi:PREDICTED: transcription repressor OFP6-like [Populus euphratica]|uniref:Transcription repressor n=1 Tax=Populus euphratica TaxID=75702 RepID=A0AAJ6V9Z8_POPEU|nr:PREDICTED: transcription repressor OFP6-like [Populus euphratica]
MFSKKKKSTLQTILPSNTGCGCGRPKLSDVYEPIPKPKPRPRTSISQKDPNPNCSSSSSCYESVGFSLMDNEEEDCTSTTITLNKDNTSSSQNSESEADPKASKIIDSIAVVKYSNDPFQDFKHSMVQMVVEKNIYSRNDLEELLNCFLGLNSPCHHSVIVQAFAEICNEIISKRIVKKPCAQLDASQKMKES